MTPAQLLAGLTPQARDEPDSGIVKAAMYGMARTGVIPLWSGEGNVPTPAAFAQPAIDSLLRGDRNLAAMRADRWAESHPAALRPHRIEEARYRADAKSTRRALRRESDRQGQPEQ